MDMFDFCVIFRHACRLSLTQRVIMSGFRKSGLWPLDPSRIMEKPHPETHSTDEPVLLSPEKLHEKYNRRCFELRNQILGSDSLISACGFIDTRNGCVVTSDKAFGLAVKKFGYDRAKRTADEAKRIEKELCNFLRDSQRVSVAAKLRAASNQNSSRLAQMNVPDYLKTQRSMKLRRKIAKQNSFDRRSKQ